jgi:hypothetical protein
VNCAGSVRSRFRAAIAAAASTSRSGNRTLSHARNVGPGFGVAERVHFGGARAAARGRDALGRSVVDHLTRRHGNLVHEIEHFPVQRMQGTQHACAVRPARAEQRPQARFQRSGDRLALREPRFQQALQCVGVERRAAKREHPPLQAAPVFGAARERGGVDVDLESQADRCAHVRRNDHVDLGVAGRMRLHRQELRDGQGLRQQRPALAVPRDEGRAEQRLGVQAEQRRQAHRGAVAELDRARMAPRLVVAVVRGDFERFTDARVRERAQPLEVVHSATAPRALDEIVVQRLKQLAGESRARCSVPSEQGLSLGFPSRHTGSSRMFLAVCHGRLCQNVTEFRVHFLEAR